jgi:hypothetical protein
MSNINIIGKKKTNEMLSLTNLANSGIYTPREVYNNVRSGILFANPNNPGYTYTSIATSYPTMYTYYQNGVLKYVDTLGWEGAGLGSINTVQQFTITTPATSFILATSTTSDNGIRLQLNGTNLPSGLNSITPNVATTYSIVILIGNNYGGSTLGMSVQLTFLT